MSDELPDFPLASWELPPDSTEPLVAPATMRWHGTLFGRETEWLVRVVPTNEESGELFVRTPVDSGEGSWWFGIISSKAHNEGLFQEITQRLHRHRRPKELRHLRLQHSGNHWIVDVNETVGCFRVAQHIEDKAPWRKKWPFDFERAYPSQVHAEIRQSWDDKTSDLNFAWRWALMSLDERIALMLSWKRGNESEFRLVVQLILRALGPDISQSVLYWECFPENEMWSLSERSSSRHEESIESGVLKIWEQALLEVFAPVWNHHLTNQYTCAHFNNSLERRFGASLDSSTFHEQLEAARELHCWLDEREARNELDTATLAGLRDTLR